MLTRYTQHELAARIWQDEIIRGYVLALARHADAIALLASLEPLDEIREHSPEGVLLWCAFSEQAGLPEVAARAMEMARVKWSGDERLRI